MDGKEKKYMFHKQASIRENCILILNLLRVRQWVKNGFVFLGLLITLQRPNLKHVLTASIGCILFCCISSAVYIFNDIVDAEKDKIHPEKRFRSIASGQVSIKVAMYCGCTIACVTLFITYYFNLYCGFILTGYLILNIVYSLKLKNYIFLDLFIISTGFSLRLLMGFVLVDKGLEQTVYTWFLLFIIFLTLFIGMGKRKTELYILKGSSNTHRHNLKDYSVELIKEIMPILTACTLITYIVYAIETHVKIIILTIPLVLYSILRYQYLAYKTEIGGKPESIIFYDKPIRICILAWSSIYIIANLSSLFL